MRCVYIQRPRNPDQILDQIPFAPPLERGRLAEEGLPATPARVENAFGVMRINGFGFSSSCGGEGRALYPQVALCSHSCQPNVQQARVLCS